MRTIAIVQARMGSTRLPGKVLAPVVGKPLLQHMIERLERCETLDWICVAIPEGVVNQAISDAVGEFFLSRRADLPRVSVYRGSENDVLRRVLGAAKDTEADLVVELTADCPLIDPKIVDAVVNEFALIGDVDFCANTHEVLTALGTDGPAYPRGMDVRVFPTEVLARVDEATSDPIDREHVSLYVWEHPKEFRCAFYPAPPHLADDIRLTVDTPEDLELVRAIFDYWAPYNDFTLKDVLNELDNQPGWRKINAGVQQKAVR